MAKKSAIQKNLNKEKQVKKSKSRRDRLKAICKDRRILMNNGRRDKRKRNKSRK